jgi:hypothetical protein
MEKEETVGNPPAQKTGNRIPGRGSIQKEIYRKIKSLGRIVVMS